MTDNRTELVKNICRAERNAAQVAKINCHLCCPLADACKPHKGDTKELFDARMNAAAEDMKA